MNGPAGPFGPVRPIAAAVALCIELGRKEALS
jgi:hypothetical protein